MNDNNGKKRKSNKGVDTLLTIRGKKLAVGESVRLRLVKGPPVQASGDPVDSKAPVAYFPMMAKFPESVRRPEFTTEPWKSARFYEQEVPKPVDDSDEEEAETTTAQQQNKKKRWRYGDGQAPRQWVLQENVDFLQTMVDRKEQKSSEKNQLSSRYEGTVEHNPSQYAIFRLHPDTTSPNDATLQVVMLPSPSETNSTVLFAQPAARKTYSLTEAEHVISDQRMGLVKTLHHMHNNEQDKGNNNNNQNDKNKDSPNEKMDEEPKPRPNILALRKKAAQSSKGRLLSKLQQKSKANTGDEEEGDDIMGDVAFRNRKGGGAARKELLTSVADSVLVSDEGVLGGANDGIFGGKQRFAQFTDASGDQQKEEDGAAAGEEGAQAAGGSSGQVNERGADGAAMEDDFYQRDVKAEYDELDYDANEQFDDDDVDLGEAEQVIESTGFGEDDLDDEMDEDEFDEDAQDGGAEGLASLAGFKALLAKARGEVPVETEAAPSQNRADERRKKETVDHMSKIMMAAEKSRLELQRKAPKNKFGNTTAKTEEMEEVSSGNNDSNEPAPAAAPKSAASETKAPMVDASGLRIISLESVKREIWLNHGQIPMKRLMKIFVVNKKATAERQAQFRDAVKELCTMKQDPVHGRMLVLKQHYSKG